MKFWSPERHAEKWMYSKVQLTRRQPSIPEGMEGVVVEWRNGWPVVLFSSKINGLIPLTQKDILDLTKDREAIWLPCRLNDLEKVEAPAQI